MADTTVEVTLKPDKGKANMLEITNHLQMIESLLDATASAPAEVTFELGMDYDDDTRILVASWEI